jgi:ribosomal protein L12E/L44/L45/RPP1/RPP2
MSDANANIPELREAADRGKEATKKAEQLERENAFLKAGIDTEDPRMSYFVKGYQGELTKDAILAEATTAGFVQAPAPATPEGGQQETEGQEPTGRRTATEEELQQEALATEVASGAAPPGQLPEEDALKVGWDEFAERRKTEPLEDAASSVIDRIMVGAVNGDERFLVTPPKS